MAGEEIAESVVVKQGGSAVGFFSVLKFLFVSHIKFFITAVLILFMIIGAVPECIKEKSFFPMVSIVGQKLLSYDEVNFYKLKAIEANNWQIPSKDIAVGESKSFWLDLKSVFAKIGLIFDFLEAFWFMFIVTYWFYLFFKLINTSGTILVNILMAILIVAFLQSAYGAVMLYLNDDCNAIHLDKCIPLEEKYSKAMFSLTPLKGTYYLVANLVNGNMINAFKVSAVAYPVEVNQTNCDTLSC